MIRNYFPGEQQLLSMAETAFPKKVNKITEHVYFFSGFGGSNCILIIGEEGCILVDALNGMEVAKEAYAEIKKITNKPIRHIIYTHYQHEDHTSGAQAFASNNPEIIGHEPVRPVYGSTPLIKDIASKRGSFQFGTKLNKKDRISVGVGPLTETPIGTLTAKKGILACTRLLKEKSVTLSLEGVTTVITSAPGETDDQVFVYFPDEKVLCCGDNFYESWPNLYAIRGSQYRDVASWITVLSEMISLDAVYLLPGHTHAVCGASLVKETLTNYKEALSYVLNKTLTGMNEGKTADELVESVVLPEEMKALPYLKEYYGTVAWSVRAIFSGYLGWFDGNPVNLFPLPKKTKAEKTIAMMGGAKNIIDEIKASIDVQEEQWALTLCYLLSDAEICSEEINKLTKECLRLLGRMQTSANARHYYLMAAQEIPD